jgi:hypothetical protein
MLKKKGGDHPWDDLAKSGYKPDMKYKSLTYFYIFGYILKMKYRNLAIFTNFFLTSGRSNPHEKSLHFLMYEIFLGHISQKTLLKMSINYSLSC